LRESGLLKTIFENPLERNYWSGIWNSLLDSGIPDSWAYRWTFTSLANGGITALPNRNLVSNVGFGVDASHTTTSADATVANLGLGPLKHPQFILRNTEADSYTFNHHFGSLNALRGHHPLQSIKKRIRNQWLKWQPVLR
jgi:hypothetical protein